MQGSCKGGFLVLEIVIALTIMMMVIPAALALAWSSTTLEATARHLLDSFASASTTIVNGATIDTASSSLLHVRDFAKSTCTVSAGQDLSHASIYISSSTQLSGSDQSTALVVRNSYIYEAINSSIQNHPDLSIINATDPRNPSIVSTLNTGPGLSALSVAGHYLYAANMSTVSQLQIIDIQDRQRPILMTSFKVPLPFSTSTAPLGASIFFDGGIVYLGTQKWNQGPEFHIIDATNPLSPHELGSFKTNTLISSIYVRGDYAYLADADSQQLRVLDIHDPTHISEVSFFSPAGSDVEEGKIFGAADLTGDDDGMLYFGRAGGGFNNPSQYELFSFNLSTDPLLLNPSSPTYFRDVPGGVYGIIVTGHHVFISVGSTPGSIQILSNTLGFLGQAADSQKTLSLVCARDRLYSMTGDANGFTTIVP